jgi:hypothetical protein
VNLRILFAIVVFGIDVWTLTRMLAQPMSRRSRLVWITVIILVPGIGAGLWWQRHRRAIGGVRQTPTDPPPNAPMH